MSEGCFKDARCRDEVTTNPIEEKYLFAHVQVFRHCLCDIPFAMMDEQSAPMGNFKKKAESAGPAQDTTYLKYTLPYMCDDRLLS